MDKYNCAILLLIASIAGSGSSERADDTEGQIIQNLHQTFAEGKKALLQETQRILEASEIRVYNLEQEVQKSRKAGIVMGKVIDLQMKRIQALTNALQQSTTSAKEMKNRDFKRLSEMEEDLKRSQLKNLAMEREQVEFVKQHDEAIEQLKQGNDDCLNQMKQDNDDAVKQSERMWIKAIYDCSFRNCLLMQENQRLARRIVIVTDAQKASQVALAQHFSASANEQMPRNLLH